MYIYIFTLYLFFYYFFQLISFLGKLVLLIISEILRPCPLLSSRFSVCFSTFNAAGDPSGYLGRWPCLFPKQLSVWQKGPKLQLHLMLSLKYIISFVSNVLYSIFAFKQCRKAKGLGNRTLVLSLGVTTALVVSVTELDFFYQIISQFKTIIYTFYRYYYPLLSIMFCQIYSLER